MVEIIVREPLISFKLYNATEGLKKHEHENHNEVALNEFDSYMNNDNYYSIEDESPLNYLSEPPQDAHPSMKNDLSIQLFRQHPSPSLDCLCFSYVSYVYDIYFSYVPVSLSLYFLLMYIMCACYSYAYICINFITLLGHAMQSLMVQHHNVVVLYIVPYMSSCMHTI